MGFCRAWAQRAGEPVQSEEGKLCQHGAGVALVGFIATFDIEGKLCGDAQWARHTWCVWGCVSRQLPNIILVLKWGTEQQCLIFL